MPETRTEFWVAKITRNKARDACAIKELATIGIASVTLWECQLKDDGEILERIAESTNST
jgi:DNA mismatch endonuclease (patch repair protein)